VDGQTVELSPRLLQVLNVLVASAGRVVSNNDLNDKVWGGTAEHNTIRVTVWALRKKLGSSNYQLIENVPSLGYRLVAQQPDVTESRKWWMAGMTALGLIVVTVAVLPTMPEPHVVSFTALTHDGILKGGPLILHNNSLFFWERTEHGDKTVSIPLDGGEPQGVPGLDRVTLLDISTSGALLGLAEDGLWLWSGIGLQPKRVSTQYVGGALWSQDGRSFIAASAQQVARFDAKTLKPSSVIGIPGYFRGILASPADHRVRIVALDSSCEKSRIWEFPPTADRPATIPGEGSSIDGMTWTSDGRYFIYARAQGSAYDLWYIREGSSLAGPRTGKLTSGPDSWYFPAAARAGNRIYVIGAKTHKQLTAYNARTDQWEPYLDGIAADGLHFSRDGQLVAYSRILERTIWVSRVDGSEAKQLTDASIQAEQPHFSPDGKTIAFMGKRSNRPWRIYLVPTKGGPPRELAKGDISQGVPTWSPTGDYIAYGEYPTAKPAAEMRIHLVKVEDGTDASVPGSEGLWTARWSPNSGELMALTRDSRIIKLFNFTTQRWSELARVSYIDNPSWNNSGQYIYGYGPDSHGYQVIYRVSRQTGSVEIIIDLKNFDSGGQLWFGLSPNDTILAANGTRSLTDIYALDCVLP
jgi:hypothetical protein